MGFEGSLWPVHPNKSTVCGLPCYASVDDLPAVPDACFIGVNRKATIDLVARLAELGAGGAVCFASGFSEAVNEDGESAQLQTALVKAAGHMPILGPNCYGFINCLDKALLWPDQHGALACASGVAIITQSSNIAINLTMQARGLPVGYVFTAGNQAQLSLAQLALTALEDDRVTAIGLHIEGFGDVREFEQMAIRAQQLGKRVVAIKVGRTEQSRQALQSHTSSLAGSEAAANAFLDRLNVARVTSLPVFIEALKLLHVGGDLGGGKLLSMSCSGGEACLMADAAAEHGLQYPPLNNAQHSALREALGPLVALANPLDYHTYIWNDYDAMRDMFAAILQSDANLALLVLDFPRLDRCTHESWLLAIDAYKAAGAKWPGQLGLLASLPENLPESIATQLINDGIVPLCGIDDALSAIAAVVGVTVIKHASTVEDYLPVALPDDVAGPHSRKGHMMSESIAKIWLGKHGVPVPQGIALSIKQRSNADNFCSQLQRPLVVKCTGVSHKSESGGVVLNVMTNKELHAAITGVGSENVLVEEQVTQSVCDLLVGIVRDPVHGFVLTIGAGGVQAEILDDVVSALLPVSRNELSDMLESLRCYPLLTGYRGNVACSVAHILDVIDNIQQAAISVADDLIELEINPLLCTPERVVAVDALVTTAKPLEPQREPL